MARIFLKDKNLYKNVENGMDLCAILRSIHGDQSHEIVAAKANGILVDLSFVVCDDLEVEFIHANSVCGLDIIRHDAAHILAKAVSRLFPGTRLCIGPSIKDGFYYDFACDGVTFSNEDFPRIEEEMAKIITAKEKFERITWSREYALSYFLSIGEDFKVEIINGLPFSDEITVYKNGDFVDLCRGPHSPNTGYMKAFKLMSVSGSYWRGDQNNASLQRVYGTAWSSKKDLNAHLLFLEEVKKRDHRKIAKDMDLFHIQEEAAGQIFWHERGWTLYRTIENYIRQKLLENGYFEVKTPALLNKSFWEKSGHWSKFRDDMFLVGDDRALKPMSCPCHIQIFNQGNRSYRDLPIRMAEFGCCYRNEASGALYGLMRVRSFVQDDAHIFCSEDQVIHETISFVKLLFHVYSDFGFKNIEVKFSDRPDVRAGDDSVWDAAETALLNAVKAAELEFTLNKGEGAFYGPKLEFVLKDAIGREWQCGTLQVDFVLPERLGASYVDSSGVSRRPVILHRAIIGTFERFIGILLEHTCGNLPFWISPLQVVILPVDKSSLEYAKEVLNSLIKLGVRSQIDFDDEKIGYRIRRHSTMKVPVIWTIGQVEVSNKSVSERRLGSNSVSVLSLNDALSGIVTQLG